MVDARRDYGASAASSCGLVTTSSCRRTTPTRLDLRQAGAAPRAVGVRDGGRPEGRPGESGARAAGGVHAAHLGGDRPATRYARRTTRRSSGTTAGRPGARRCGRSGWPTAVRCGHAQPARAGREGAIAAYIQTSEYDASRRQRDPRGLRRQGRDQPQHRRRGLAGVLLRVVLQRYREEGFDRAALDVDSENPTGALGIYERAGFRTEMRWTSYRLESRQPDRAVRRRQ